MLNNKNGSVLPNQETEESLPSIFSKLSTSSEDVPPPPPPNTSKTVASEVSSVSSPTSPNMIPCICFNCWTPYKLTKTWKSPDEMNMKRKSMGKETDNMEQTQSSTTVSSPFPPTACSFSPSFSTTTIPLSSEQFPTVTLISTVSQCSLDYCGCKKKEGNEESLMRKENELLRKKAVLQWEVIRNLMAIGHISDELREMSKKN